MYFNVLEQESEFENNNVKSLIEEEGLKYIAGYVAYKYRLKYPHLGCQTKKMSIKLDNSDWLHAISDGHLLYPSESLIKTANIINKEFINFHGSESLRNNTFIFQRLPKLVKPKISKAYNISDDVIKCLIRTRSYIRLRQMQKKKKIGKNKKENCLKKDNYKPIKSNTCEKIIKDKDLEHSKKKILKFTK